MLRSPIGWNSEESFQDGSSRPKAKTKNDDAVGGELVNIKSTIWLFIIGPSHLNFCVQTSEPVSFMCSQHDTTVIALQASLNVFNHRQPPYAACHIFELYRDDNGWDTLSAHSSTHSQPLSPHRVTVSRVVVTVVGGAWFCLSACACSSASVLMFFRNDSAALPYPLQLPGCALDCPLEDFVRITKFSIADDRSKECQLPTENRGHVSAED